MLANGKRNLRSISTFSRSLELFGTVFADFSGYIMRTLLRHAPTGQYFQSLEKWTKTPKKAHDFGFITRALRFVKKTGFADMELIVSFDHPRQPTLFQF
jgi:hypothetical protein